MRKQKKQKIVPCLWFDHQAEEAVNFYTSIFENSGINAVAKYPEAGQEIHGKEAGTIMTIDFKVEGYQLVALNGGPHFQFNPSISFFVICKNTEEIDHYWNELLKGGEVLMPLDSYDWSERYGWLQDKYGLNWQFMIDTGENTSPRISPLLFYTGESHKKAEDAINFYTSVFENSMVEGILKYQEEDKNDYSLGGVKHAQFRLEGETFMAMDSGTPNDYPFNEALSFIINCEDQQEIDTYWEKLTQDGDPQAQQCGWLKDKFGLSWQVVPVGMDEIFNDPDKEKTNRAMQAMLQMKKIDMDTLMGLASKSP